MFYIKCFQWVFLSEYIDFLKHCKVCKYFYLKYVFTFCKWHVTLLCHMTGQSLNKPILCLNCNGCGSQVGQAMDHGVRINVRGENTSQEGRIYPASLHSVLSDCCCVKSELSAGMCCSPSCTAAENNRGPCFRLSGILFWILLHPFVLLLGACLHDLYACCLAS